MTIRFSRQWLLVVVAVLAAAVSAKDTPAKVLSKTHPNTGHAAIEDELRHAHFSKSDDEDEKTTDKNVEAKSFTCTLTGATGQDQCDAATDDDGSKCTWCFLSSYGFCISETQATQFKQIMPTIDCDDSSDDDKTPDPDTDDAAPSPLFECLESKDEAGCATNTCVWCNTKGGFGVCLTTEAAAMAADSYWFACPEEETDLQGEDQYDDDAEDEYEEYKEGEEDDEAADDDAEDDEEYDEDEEEEDEVEDMHEFVVDTSCVMAGIVLNPEDDDATSEAACFAARDISGNPCEWCSVAGSPFRLCLSEPQAQVAEYVGAVCSGSDESFEPEDFDDSCVAHQHAALAADGELTRYGCWKHRDLDGNGCEWCNIMGVELCFGGVQAELVEHWGATCVMDDEEHQMAEEAIQQHLAYMLAEKEQAKKNLAKNEESKKEPSKEDDEEEELDLNTLWLTSDPSCMVTTLRTTNGDDPELACARKQDAEGYPCNWCQMGTSFNMCLNEEQAEVAEALGISCVTVSFEAEDILKDHDARTQQQLDDEFDDDEDEDDDGEYDDDEEEEDDVEIDPDDLDPSCLMAMQAGPDQATCLSTMDQGGTTCEWCSWNSFNVCLASKQAKLIEPFGVTCAKHASPSSSKRQDMKESFSVKEDFWNCLEQSKKGVNGCSASNSPCTWCNTKAEVGLCLSNEAVIALHQHEFFDCIDQGDAQPAIQHGPPVDTSCLVDAGRFGDERKCQSSKDATGKPCEWCKLGSIGVNACMSADQAKQARPVGVTCGGKESMMFVDEEGNKLGHIVLEEEGDVWAHEILVDEEGNEIPPPLQELPEDFWPCLSQSKSLLHCDETCTWCDFKGTSSGVGLCLSDIIADVVTHYSGDSIFDCTEPDDDDDDDDDDDEEEQDNSRMADDAMDGKIA